MIGQRILQYEIKHLVGEGGMGNVYLAEHINKQLGRKVAIKSLPPQFSSNEQLRARFAKAAAIIEPLNHPNLVMLYDYVEDEKGMFLIMEYVDGVPLDDYIINTTGPIPNKQATLLMLQILEGMRYSHNKGVIHRDIKPSNILVTKDGQVKVSDFGIAKSLIDEENALTKSGNLVGTPFYMSPEQVRGEMLDIRSDIYSLGVTFFQMLTGVCPYEGLTNEYAVYSKIVNDPLPDAGLVYPGVTQAMERVIKKATQKDRNLRYQNCEAFIKALSPPETVEVDKPDLPPISNPEPPPSPPPLPPSPLPVKESSSGKWIIVFSLLMGVMLIILVVANNRQKPAVTSPIIDPVGSESSPLHPDSLSIVVQSNNTVQQTDLGSAADMIPFEVRGSSVEDFRNKLKVESFRIMKNKEYTPSNCKLNVNTWEFSCDLVRQKSEFIKISSAMSPGKEHCFSCDSVLIKNPGSKVLIEKSNITLFFQVIAIGG